ncbi:MAG TPA: hypothetical protein VFN23_02965 [Ktedonobacteraceae bacterium]|nr:hypothetical protein [Ktedonobacteraceae bacterium]
MSLALTKQIATFDFNCFSRDLNQLLDYIWSTHFPDVSCKNEIVIRYSYPWKRRLGLIRMALDESSSLIGINSLLQHPEVPEAVLITTVAHELCHYAHGFGSPLPQLYEHPHANNVINLELEKRHLSDHARKCDEWIDKAWFPFYDRQRNSGWIGIPGTRKSTHQRPMLVHRQTR